MRASDEVIDKFPDIFKATKGYQALPINQKGSNGKVKFTYTAITGAVSYTHLTLPTKA